MSVYEIQVHASDGALVPLSAYRGKVLLIVNTASGCGYSRQFADLQKLYETYSPKGFEVLAFPCNQFNGKEPGSNSDIQRHCRQQLGLTFPLFEKVELRPPSIHPLFDLLTRHAPFQSFALDTAEGRWMNDFLQAQHPDLYNGDGVKWNFTKFLLDRSGMVVARYETPVEPLSIESAIGALL